MNETKLIFALNVTIDGFADHTEVIADEELHDFHTRLLDAVDTILFGRKTYELMESYWPNADKDPLSTRDMIDFANQINSMHKIVFSKTLTEVTWNNTDLVKTDMVEEVKRLKQQSGKVISIGGISAASELA
ncbi:MAG TPA: dihydrofolate reductase family protein, partial [Ignavibacteriaceae bacterium]